MEVLPIEAGYKITKFIIFFAFKYIPMYFTKIFKSRIGISSI